MSKPCYAYFVGFLFLPEIAQFISFYQLNKHILSININSLFKVKILICEIEFVEEYLT